MKARNKVRLSENTSTNFVLLWVEDVFSSSSFSAVKVAELI